MTTYPVNERFVTFQGEGVHMGRSAFFVRLHGCPVHCPWCDSAGTWHPDWVPKDVKKMTSLEIAGEAVAEHTDMVVITGGEPTVYNLNDLVLTLREKDLNVHLETSGAFPITGLLDWITLSPKKWAPPIEESINLADEYKIIVEHPDDIHFYYEMLVERGLPLTAKNPIWLHPEWSHRGDPAVLAAIAKAATIGGGVFRAGWQLHKLYQVDSFDKRSRPLVPLGGDAQKGV